MKKLLTALLLLSPGAAFAAAAAPAKNYFLEYYVFEIAGLMACLTVLSESAVRRGALQAARARSGWNWLLLLASFAACVLAGFALFLPLEKQLARPLFKLHIWTGVVCGWAGLYHAARRARSM